MDNFFSENCGNYFFSHKHFYFFFYKIICTFDGFLTEN